MDQPSSSSSADQYRFRTALPYQPLLRQLTILLTREQNYQRVFPFPLMFIESWRQKFQLTPHMTNQISTLQWELAFQQMVFTHLRNYPIFEFVQQLDDIQFAAEKEAEQINQATVIFNDYHDFQVEERSFYFGQLESEVAKFMTATVERIIKPRLKKFCLESVDLLLQGNPYKVFDIFAFIDIVLWKMEHLEKVLNPNLITPVKNQMEILVDALHLISINHGKWTVLDENLNNFLVYFGPLVSIAATIVTLYWVDENDEELLAMAFSSSSSLRKFNLFEAYITLIKLINPTNDNEILTMGETVRCFVQILLEKLVDISADIDEIEQGLLFWISLVMDPPRMDDAREDEKEKLLCGRIRVLVGEAESLIRKLFLGDEKNLVNEFLEKINEVEGEVRQLQVEIRGLLGNNNNNNVVPETNRMGFLDFLMGNLRKKFRDEARMFPFEKHLIEIVHDELLILKPFLVEFFEFQDDEEHKKEVREIWMQANNVDYFTDLCLSSTLVPIWSILIHLSNAKEKIQSVKAEISTRINKKKSVKVGFMAEENKIIDRLIAGGNELDIVAIVGMPGQGKTNLAQRVFLDSSVRHHFHKCAWCHISQAYDIRRILLDILENMGELLPSTENLDLADLLRKSLKGRRYLIVLDDIWDVKAWRELKLSFPDDNKGSRILVTSRNQNVPFEIKPNCSSIVELHPLSIEESWNLLVMKVFDEDCCPPTLSHIGKTIAEKCSGLPLTIVVVAGFLKKDKNVDSWKRISETVTKSSSDDCMNILDLSYVHLPDHLKPCFLYFGAFQEGQVIRAKQLFQLWIAEGFVQNEFVAKGNLMDLVSRSLVLVTQRSSRNGIKICRVHDLLHQLCLTIAEKERFFIVPKVFDKRYCHHYRLCFRDNKWMQRFSSTTGVSSVRSLHFSSIGHHYNNTRGFLKAFKLLKVLDLNEALVVTQDDFHDITRLIHLKFLAVACRFAIPASIVNLFRLEVLRFRYANTPIVLPDCLLEMPNLRHVFASVCTILSDSDETVPEPDLEFSPPISTNSLDTLTKSVFMAELPLKRLALKIPNILKLGLVISFSVPLSNYFEKLESLNLSIVAGQLLKESTVLSPSRLDFPMTVKKLALTADSCLLSASMVSSIGKMCNLEVLKLHVHFENGRWDVEDDEFLKLKYFEFRFSSIMEWNLSDESFPCLEQLVVKRCAKLEQLPSRFGEIYSLRRIEVCNCSDGLSNSFEKIVGIHADNGNGDLQFSIS